ncbi:hypothetical protein MMC06_006655 [Schaereria dolodes]|nr:hypothetical protein [Schaereria dolodes]
MVKRSREDSTSSRSSSSGLSADAVVRAPKYTQTIDDSHSIKVMQCSLPPHQPISFSTYTNYDVHYAQVHVNRCSECRRNLPTEYFLALHIEENHDPLKDALRAKGEKTNYDFFIVNDGIDKRTSMLRSRPVQHRRRSSATNRAQTREQQSQRRLSALAPDGSVGLRNGNAIPQQEPVSTSMPQDPLKSTGPEPKNAQVSLPSYPPASISPTQSHNELSSPDEMDILASSMSALKFIPSSVRFGRGGRRGGLARS